MRRRFKKPPKVLVFVRQKLTFPDFSIHFDGSCWPNHGGIPKYGVVVYDRIGKELESRHGIADDEFPMTNNTAEFSGMLEAVKIGQAYSSHGVVSIIGDSQLAIRAMQGLWQMPKSPHLNELANRCRKVILKYENDLYFEWVPREENARADELAE